MKRTTFAIALLATALPAAAQDDAERELARVKAAIESLEAEQARQIRRRDDGQDELKRVEVALAATRAELARLGREADGQRRRQAEIEAEIEAARDRLGDEHDALGEQARMSYMTGRQELVKLLLSQESPADLGRMLVYYDYLNRARSDRIAAVNGEIDELARLSDEAVRVAGDLARLQREREAELARLDADLEQRRGLLATLDAEIESADERIARMRADEARLTELVEDIARRLADFPVTSDAPFSTLKGELTWPVDGRRVANFGALREGGPLRWQGVMLEAAGGTVVRSVYHGRVAFADWLPLMGLMIIVDHGEGYMSLYGHNGALLRDVGDWVAPGEAIAEVGDSGGQAAPALYFEIRHDGDPVDPGDWIR
ncbi:MAG: peptidoglycan DD-metalloendopeptidase family protein [Gammaproteobacteria bacterium]|nr:peptidoglycan DD-metalloendopeptidase family protein [Gammaproteobacteria bacterium]